MRLVHCCLLALTATAVVVEQVSGLLGSQALSMHQRPQHYRVAFLSDCKYSWGSSWNSAANSVISKVTVGQDGGYVASTTARLSSGTSHGGTRPVRIIISGAPASGKGTQCEKIKEQYGVVHLSTGDILRAAVSAGTPLGQKAKDYMDSGKLVPDEVIISVVEERLREDDCVRNGWLLDGFPRTKAQAQALEDAGVCADCFLFLNVPDDVLVERVVGRRTDPITGMIYHTKFKPATEQEVIDRLEQRSDDTEEKVKVRLEQFHANMAAVKDSYTDISVSVDGNQSPDQVSEAILSAIESNWPKRV